VTKRTKNIWKTVLICLFAAWIGFLVKVNWAMHQSPETFGHFMSKLPMPAYFIIPFETLWSRARAGTIKVGDQAPDFNLPNHDKSGSVRLSQFRGQKPVVLVFGSYT
jgi:hypothetical protein